MAEAAQPDAQPLQPDKALYYPHVEFASAAWVKTALLYWEAVARPVEVVPDERDPEIRQLVDAGLIENVPEAPFRPRAVEVFGDELETLLGAKRGIPTRLPGARGVTVDAGARRSCSGATRSPSR